ncbi:MAG TPA: CRISPR-associated endonuclease Cas1 [Ktedonobacterales bacterium]
MAAMHGLAPREPPPIRTALYEASTSLGTTGLTHITRGAEEIGSEWREAGEHWTRVVAWLRERREASGRRQAQIDQGDGPHRLASEGRTVTLGGFGAGLFIRNGQLLIKQGTSYSTEPAEDETLARGLHNVTTLVWIVNGGAGSLSVQALKWCAQQAVTVVLITDRGQCLAVVHPAPDASPALGIPGRQWRQIGNRAGQLDVRLRRAQYALQPTGRDIVIARRLIRAKIAAQASTALAHPELPDQRRAVEACHIALAWLELEPATPFLSDLLGVRILEGKAAQGYFAGWVGLALRVEAKARERWPKPWLTVATRQSPLTRFQSPRRAANPAQAILNWCYALLETQMRQSLNVIGADAACGILHADEAGRDSLVFDAMEPLRGAVEHLVLSFWQDHVFGAGDFQADTAGVVLIHPTLQQVLVEACRLPQRRVDESARELREWILGN